MKDSVKPLMPYARKPKNGQCRICDSSVGRLAHELDEGVVVCVLADGGWKYLSADFWDAADVETSMERTVWW